MAALDPLDLELLNFLCSASHHRCRVVRIKSARMAALRRLREAGFVGPDDFIPSAGAIADWLVRRDQTRVPADLQGSAEPPEPGAAAKGGGAARCVAPPPSRGGAPSMAERARRFEDQRPAKARESKAKKSDPARAMPAAEAPRHRAHEREAAPADSPVGQPRAIADPPQPPPPSFSPEKQDFLRANAARLRAGRERAAAFLDSGKTSLDAGSVTLRIEARKLEVWRAEEARRNDPLEQAKTLIRCKTRFSVFAAEVTLGEAGQGQFFIGNKLVSKAELLAMAKRLAA